jgi:DNA-binding XRE family transcriptional regulator
MTYIDSQVDHSKIAEVAKKTTMQIEKNVPLNNFQKSFCIGY